MYASLFPQQVCRNLKIEALCRSLLRIFDSQGIIMFPIRSLTPQQAEVFALGAGFIRTEEGKDVFFNIKAVHDCDLQIMQRGQCVSFDILKNEDRIPLSAANVKTIESSACDLM